MITGLAAGTVFNIQVAAELSSRGASMAVGGLLALGLALVAPGPMMILERESAMPRHLSPDETAMARWMAAEPGGHRLVLSYVLTGNRLAGLTSHRVLLGHRVPTPNYEALTIEAQAWYQGRLGEAWLQQRRIGHVVWGPYERRWTTKAPLQRPPDFANGSFQVWRISRPG
jgi:hypothetical protein